MCLPKIEIKRAILKTPQGRFNECGLKQVWQSILCFSFCLFATQRCDLCVKEEKGKNVWKPPTLKRFTFMKTYWGNVIIQVVFLHFQTPLHRQRHPQEDDPVSGWPLLKDTEDQNPSHGWTRSRVPSQWNDQGSTSRPVWEFFCYHRDRKSEMRSAVDRHHGCLHNNITWHACIMWSRSGEWNGNWVNQSRVLVMRLLSARERLQITLFFTVQH